LLEKSGEKFKNTLNQMNMETQHTKILVMQQKQSSDRCLCLLSDYNLKKRQRCLK
jgi:hypothetical protein